MTEIRVLLIDDHPIVRSGIRMLLEQADDILVVAESDRGDDVMQMIHRHNPHVLLLDMEMPGKSGVEVVREIQAAGLSVRILALSAYDDTEEFGIHDSEQERQGYAIHFGAYAVERTAAAARHVQTGFIQHHRRPFCRDLNDEFWRVHLSEVL